MIWRSHVLRVTTLARRNIHIDEVQHVSPSVIAHERRHGVVPRNVYRRSLVRPHHLPKKASLLRSRKRPARTPPSTFLFLPIHLSNSPEIMVIPLPGDPGSRRSPRLPNQIGCLVTLSVRSFAGAPSRRRRAARRCGAYIVGWSQACQLPRSQISPQRRAVDFTLCHRHIGVPNRRAAPHSRHIPPAFFAPG